MTHTVSQPTGKLLSSLGHLSRSHRRDPSGVHRDGLWETCLPLQHGQHEYRFVVDGTWVNDLTCTDVVSTPFDSTNYVLEV